MTERELTLLKALSEANAPSGFEDETANAARAAMEDICDVEEDSLRNLYLIHLMLKLINLSHYLTDSILRRCLYLVLIITDSSRQQATLQLIMFSLKP